MHYTPIYEKVERKERDGVSRIQSPKRMRKMQLRGDVVCACKRYAGN